MIQASDRYRVNRFHRRPLPVVNVGFEPTAEQRSFKSSIKQPFNTFKRQLYVYEFGRLRSDRLRVRQRRLLDGNEKGVGS